MSGRSAIPLDKQVLMLLYWLAHQEQFRLLGDRFNVSESTAHTLCHRLIEIITQELSAKFIQWPDAERQRVISNFYGSVMHFPGVIGCIGLYSEYLLALHEKIKFELIPLYSPHHDQ